MRRYGLTFAVTLFAFVQVVSAALQPGDVAIIGFNCDDPDELGFVALADLGEGEVIKFTDSGWRAAGGFRAVEGIDTYTVPAGGLAAGSIISLGPVSMMLSTSGDQIIVYQGADAAPTLIYALNDEGAGVWQADATSANTSAFPTGLISGTTALALNEIDNAVFDTSVLASGTKSEWLAAIANPANWIGSDAERHTMPPSITVTSGDPDLDEDGIPDWWETLHYGGPTNANPDAIAANGINTVREAWIADLNPTNPASSFRITAISSLPPFTVCFISSSNRQYALNGCSNLPGGSWTNVPGIGPRIGAGGVDSMGDTNNPPYGLFYRLTVELP